MLSDLKKCDFLILTAIITALVVFSLPTVVSAQRYAEAPPDIFQNIDLRKRGAVGFRDYGYEIVSSDAGHPVRVGDRSIRVEVRGGDCGSEPGNPTNSDCLRDRERHEVQSQNFSGEKYLYFSLYVPEYFNLIPDGVNTSLAQFYGDYENILERGPAVMFRINGTGQFVIESSVIENVSSALPIQYRGQWNDFVIYADWTDDDDGFMYIFNGDLEEPVFRWRGATLQEGVNQVKFVFGIYRSYVSRYTGDVLPTQVAYYDAVSLSSRCLDGHLDFSCAAIEAAVANDNSPQRTCDGSMCPPVYQRTAEVLEAKFQCLLAAISNDPDAAPPTQDEIQNLIQQLGEITTYRTKNHLRQLGLREESVDQHRVLLLQLVNGTDDADSYCSRYGSN